MQMQDFGQSELINAASQKIRACGFQIRGSLKNNDLIKAIEHAAEMTDQLRLNIHSPKNYYDIYISITDELRKFEAFLTDEFTHGQRINNLYEVVQYNPYVLPRLYMMITVGVVYLNTKIFPAKELLRDMSEMCRGVQHPMRGLFLRNYLLQAVKETLSASTQPPNIRQPSHAPSHGSSNNDNENSSNNSTLISEQSIAPRRHSAIGSDDDYDGEDAIDFILKNFCEMNRLWVQLQYRGHSREQSIREQERKELKLLVGTNISCLSQLPNLSLEVYAERILPFLCEQLINCKDGLAQEYIFECIVQAFPDTFHVNTFEKLMSTLIALHATISHIDRLMESLTDRLADFSNTDEGYALFNDERMVSKCSDHVQQIIQNTSCISRDEAVGLHKCVLTMALKSTIPFDEKLATANISGNAVNDYLQAGNCSRITVKSPLGAQLLNFLQLYVSPTLTDNSIAKCDDNQRSVVLDLIRLDSFYQLMCRLEHVGQMNTVSRLFNGLNDNGLKLTNADDARLVLKLLDQLLLYPWLSGNDAMTIADQQLLGTFPHLLELTKEEASVELDVFGEVLTKLENSTGSRQLLYRLSPLVSAALCAIVKRYHQNLITDELETYYSKMLMDIVYPAIAPLFSDHIESALRLLVNAAMVSSATQFAKSESCAYEFITQAFALFEDGIVESQKQVNALTLIIGAVQKMHCFSDQDQAFSSLRKTLSQASMLLIKRPDQCRLLIQSSNLYWDVKKKDQTESIYNFKDAFDCLARARRIAAKCIDHITQAQLLIDIVDQYIYFIDHPMCKKAIADKEVFPVDVMKEMLSSVSNLLRTSRQKDMNVHLSERATKTLEEMKSCEALAKHFEDFELQF